MSSFILEEGQLLFNSILLGIGITFLYDCLRVFRRVFLHSIFWISVEDLFYWLFVSVSIFHLLYYENNGSFRWFAILGTLTGMLLYRKTLSPLWVTYVTKLFLWIKRLLGRIFGFLTRPFRAAAGAAGKGLAHGRRKMKRSARILKKRLTVWARTAKIILCKRPDKFES